MTNTAKAVILAVGITIAAWLIGVMLKPFSLLVYGLVTGPGLFVQVIFVRYLAPGTISWLVSVILQFVIIYFICLWIYTRPTLWPLRIGLLVFAWVGVGYLGWLVVR